jgi:hypothetical protein
MIVGLFRYDEKLPSLLGIGLEANKQKHEYHITASSLHFFVGSGQQSTEYCNFSVANIAAYC